MNLKQIDAFGAPAVPTGVSVVGLPAGVGQLTAYHADAVGETRGTVLFVPGFTGSKEDFREFLPLLSAQGWDVWAYSQRGQGDSVGPVGVENYTLELFASDVLEVAAMVGNGEPVHLLGHSFGGIVAPEAAIARPGAFLSLTVLCSGPNGWPGRHSETSATLAQGGSIGLWNRDNPHTLGLADEQLTPEEAFLRRRAQRARIWFRVRRYCAATWTGAPRLPPRDFPCSSRTESTTTNGRSSASTPWRGASGRTTR